MSLFKSVSVAVRQTLPDKISKEVLRNAQNLSTQEETEKKGAWLQKENENGRRKSSS